MQAILHWTLGLIEHRPLSARSRRGEAFNPTAKALGRALLGDPTLGSTSSESDIGPPKKKVAETDVDYCEPREPSSAGMSAMSMKKILELRQANRSHAAIQKLYPNTNVTDWIFVQSV